jgi:hypothetical protein
MQLLQRIPCLVLLAACAGPAHRPDSAPSPAESTPVAGSVDAPREPDAPPANREPPPAATDVATRAAAPDTRAAGPDAPGAPRVDPDANGSCQGAIVCSDFEADTVGMVPKGWRGGASTVVDGTRAFSGKNSVLAKGGSMSISLAGRLPNNQVFGRAMVWLDSAVPLNQKHYGFLQASGAGGSLYGVHTELGKWLALFYLSGNADCGRRGPVPQVQKWMCLEWDFNAKDKKINTWIDGQLVIEHYSGYPNGFICPAQWGDVTLQSFSIGWSAVAPAQVWFDDVALDTKRIGCPKP